MPPRRDLPFEDDDTERGSADPTLVVDVGGFEGPLDLLLDLARRQKVDLHEISILALAEQYIAFIESARAMRLEIAADYLVMAAWLAYLKSRLLLPEPPKPDGPNAEDMAQALAVRLRRLEAIRHLAERLGDRDQLGREVFARGEPESAAATGAARYTGTLYDLLAAYATQRQRRITVQVTVAARQVWSLAEAREALERLMGQGAAEWVALDTYLMRYLTNPGMRPTILASALSAALEMVREGKAVLRQDKPFAPLMFRSATPALRVVSP